MKRVQLMVLAVVVALAFSLVAHAPASGKSRYDSVLATAAGRKKLAALARMENAGSVDAAALKSLVSDRDPLVRLRCAEVLGRIGHSPAIPFLVTLTEDEDPRVVETAVYALGLVGDTLVLAPLERCLRGKPALVKERALEALGKTGLHRAAPLIVPYLRNFSGTIRARAALALAFSGDSASARELEPSIHDPDPHAAACAIYAMGRLGYRNGAEQIAEFLVHEDAEVRLRAAEALGRLKLSDAARALAPLTKDPDRMVAIKAVEALSRIASRKGTTALEALLASKDSYLKTVALGGLAAIGAGQSFEAIKPLLKDPSAMVRRAALGAAAATGKMEARPFLLAALPEATAYEKMTALEVLGGLSAPEDLPLLVHTLDAGNAPLLREGAATGLGAWKRPDELARPCAPQEAGGQPRSPVQALLAAADGDDWVVASIAVESLGKVGPVAVIPDLMRIYSRHGTRLDGDRKLAIVEAIAAMASRVSADERGKLPLSPFFATACAEPDPRIAPAAVKAAARFDMKLMAAPAGAWNRGKLPWGDPSVPLGSRRILVETTRGRIEILLFGDDAPNTVKSILYLAKHGSYDGLTFHRVVPGFVIQGGCPRGDGWGDMGYFVRNEINLYHYGRGTVGMADSGLDTGGSQFFITHTPQPHLNGRYTIVGRVTKGMDVVDSIEEGDTFTVKVID